MLMELNIKGMYELESIIGFLIRSTYFTTIKWSSISKFKFSWSNYTISRDTGDGAILVMNYPTEKNTISIRGEFVNVLFNLISTGGTSETVEKLIKEWRDKYDGEER